MQFKIWGALLNYIEMTLQGDMKPSVTRKNRNGLFMQFTILNQPFLLIFTNNTWHKHTNFMNPMQGVVEHMAQS